MPQETQVATQAEARQYTPGQQRRTTDGKLWEFEAAQPLTPAQTISGFGGGQSIVRGIAGIPGLLANPGGEAGRRLFSDDPSRPGLATRTDYLNQLDSEIR